MANERDPKAISLADARARRAHDTGSAAHARGHAFAFERRDDLGDDDADVGHAGGEVVILLDVDAKTGIALSPDAARHLARTLIECADLAKKESPNAR